MPMPPIGIRPDNPDDDNIFTELLQETDTKAHTLARSYLCMARKSTRELPSLLPTKAQAVCAFLAAANPAVPGTADAVEVAKRAIAHRGNARKPSAFWKAVDAVQTLLVDAARDSCGQTFEYSALPSNEPKCRYCAKKGIRCLRSKGGGRAECYACCYLRLKCGAGDVADKQVDDCVAEVVVLEDDDDDEPVLASFKRRRTDDAARTDAKKPKLDEKVSHHPGYCPRTLLTGKQDSEVPNLALKEENNLVEPTAIVSGAAEGSILPLAIRGPSAAEVDAFAAVHDVVVELIVLARACTRNPPALHDAILDMETLPTLSLPARSPALEHHLRALQHDDFVTLGAGFQYMAGRVLHKADAELRNVRDVGVRSLVLVLRRRVEVFAAAVHEVQK